MSSAVESRSESVQGAVAPWWHTVLVLALFWGASLASFYEHGIPNVHLPGMSLRLSGCLTTLVLEWVVTLLVWLALKQRKLSFQTLVQGRWATAGSFFKDLGFAVGFVIVAIGVVQTLGYFSGMSRIANDVASQLPKTVPELVAFLALALSAAFCEEVVFRGYLSRQFGAWTGSRYLALVLQGVAFGLSHGYYRQFMWVIMIHGCLLGLLAHWRKSLRPGILAHGLQDTLGGILGFLTVK